MCSVCTSVNQEQYSVLVNNEVLYERCVCVGGW